MLVQGHTAWATVLCGAITPKVTLCGIDHGKMDVISIGYGWHQVQLTYLLPHIPQAEFAGHLHFGHHTLGFPDPIQTCLFKYTMAQVFF
jgi:hypothetical protein